MIWHNTQVCRKIITTYSIYVTLLQFISFHFMIPSQRLQWHLDQRLHRRFSTSCFSTQATATSQVVNCSHDNSKKTPLFPILTLLPPTSPLSASPLTLFSSHPWWWWYCKSLDPRCRRFVRRRLLPSHHGYKPGNRVSRGVPPLRNGHGREVVVEVVFLRVHDI